MERWQHKNIGNMNIRIIDKEHRKIERDFGIDLGEFRDYIVSV